MSELNKTQPLSSRVSPARNAPRGLVGSAVGIVTGSRSQPGNTKPGSAASKLPRKWDEAGFLSRSTFPHVNGPSAPHMSRDEHVTQSARGSGASVPSSTPFSISGDCRGFHTGKLAVNDAQEKEKAKSGAGAPGAFRYVCNQIPFHAFS